jgi:DnaA family protein
MKQIPLSLAPPAQRSFDNFIAGANEAALTHLRALAAGSDPVYLWGPAGCGKTHVMQALVHRFQASGATVGWFGNAEPLPWQHDDSRSLIVLDACERLGDEQQQAAFALLAQAAGSGTTVLAAGRVPPVDLPLREDLRTRLAWGHVFALQPLSDAEVRAALRRESDNLGAYLSDEVLDYLLSRFERNLQHLMALLARLNEFSLAEKRTFSVPLLKKMLLEEDLLHRKQRP